MQLMTLMLVVLVHDRMTGSQIVIHIVVGSGDVFCKLDSVMLRTGGSCGGHS